MPIRNDVASSESGVASPAETAAAKAIETAATAPSATIRSRRGSTTSVSAPAGKVRRKNGRVVSDLDSGYQSRARIETGHQPGRTRVEHRQSDARKRGREENDHKSAIAEQARGALRRSMASSARRSIRWSRHSPGIRTRCGLRELRAPIERVWQARTRADGRARAYRFWRRNAPACASARRPGSSRAFQSGHAWIMCGQISRVAETSAPPAAAAKRTASSSRVSAEPI